MASLTDALTSEDKISDVVSDCLVVIDQEVADKSGLSGLAIKAGFKTIKGVKPGFIQNAVRDLIPEFAKALDPIYQEASGSDSSVSSYFKSNSGRVADALLAITDGKAQRSTNKIVKGTYNKLRGTAKKNVESAVPRLSGLVEKHA